MILEEVDFVLAGAEAVVENGGIINRVLILIYLYFRNQTDSIYIFLYFNF